MDILIIEDDDYKLESLKNFALTELGCLNICVSESLKEALESIAKNAFDLIFVDMAIPSHPKIAGQGTPVSFNTGGLEVIMELAAMGRSDPCIIITQYPDIEISGEYIPIGSVKTKLPQLLECDVVACILYEEDSDSWELELKEIFRDLFT